MIKAGFRPRQKQEADVVYGPYWRRQYIFVAATMPAVTSSDVGGEIQHMFPEATWIATDLLHQSKPVVQHSWIEVGGCKLQVLHLETTSVTTHVPVGWLSRMSGVFRTCALCKYNTLNSCVPNPERMISQSPNPIQFNPQLHSHQAVVYRVGEGEPRVFG